MFKIYKNGVATISKRYFCLHSETNKSRNTIRTALLQLRVGPHHIKHLEHAEASIRRAKENGAKLVILPECPYSNRQHIENSECARDGPSVTMFSRVAKEHSIYLVGGTIPEIEDSKLYNTCTVWNPNGEMIASFRKLHLFDVEIPNRITFKESDVLTAGSKSATFMLDDVKVGLGICHDLRFEELAKLYRMQNCKLLIYPSAFSMSTGPIHFELLQRARAVDNQVYVICVSPARGLKGYIAWGHSQVTDPWGEVVLKAGYDEELLYYDLDLNLCDEVQQQVPIFNQRRLDIYNATSKN